jgi:diguanylate cyclase (GGDEF)-like protein
MVLSMVSGGAPLSEVATALVRLVEDQETAARCAILGREADGGVHVIAAPSLSPLWHQAIERHAAESTDTADMQDPAWLCHPTVLPYVDDESTPHHPAVAATAHLHVCSTMPVFVDGVVAGVLVVYYEAPHTPDVAETARLASYAQLAAVALSRAKSEHQLHLRMSMDSTTGLPTGNAVTLRLAAALERRRRTPGSLVAVIAVDLPRLHEYNTTFGFGAGDEVLRFVASALEATIGGAGVVVRTGGARFMLIVEGMTGPGDVVELAHHAGRAACGPVVLGDHPVALEAAVGVAVAERGDESPEQLLDEAQAAAAHARTSPRDRVAMFDPAVARRASDRLVLELGLHRALAHDELVVHYQPVWSISRAQVVGVEALVRWEDPEHGLRQPADFIGVAEATGLIRQVTRKVLETACQQVAAWHRQDPSVSLQVSVNVSPVELHDPTLIADVRHAIRSSGIAPHLLCLELTETAIMSDAGAALEVLAQLKGLGVVLAIDDFGTGYSSLAYLRRLPVDYLKIDRSFITAMLHSPEDEAIVATVVTLARTLGLRIVAEGVETEEHVHALRDMTCAYGQGFHWSPALPADGISQLLHLAT